MEPNGHVVSILKNASRKRVLRRIVALLSAIIMFVTIDSLKIDADTLERLPSCGIEAHTHADDCYDAADVLVCGLAEHAHTDACYQARPIKGDGQSAVEGPVEEAQETELYAENGQNDGIEIPPEELGVVMLGDDADLVEAAPFDMESIDARADAEDRGGYIVGTQYPFYLSDVIASLDLELSVDDVVEVRQAIENDDDPILFTCEHTDGDIALYVNQDFERAGLVIATAGDVEVVELLYGIAPVENSDSIEEAVQYVSDEIQAMPDEQLHAVKMSYAATVDLAGMAFPLSLNELMAQAEIASVKEPALFAEADEAIEPMPSEEMIELGEASDDSEPWAMDYDASFISIEKGEDGYALSVIADFVQTVLTIDTGDLYTITLLNGAMPNHYPAAAFSAATDHVAVDVAAEEGAFPAGTAMVVTDVEDEAMLSSIADKVEEGFVRVERVHAVDITFMDADGAEIEPLKPVSVVMTVREIEEEKESVVVHVDHEGEAQVVETVAAATPEAADIENMMFSEVVEAEASVAIEAAIADEADASELTASSIAFTADAFSVYALVVGEKLETKVIAADGNAYRIEVTYTEAADIPAGACLDVTEVTENETYLSGVEALLNEKQGLALARFFDIKIMVGEDAVQPRVPVRVSVTLANDEEALIDDAAPYAVHVTEDGLTMVEATRADEALTFTADGFSVWGVIYTVDFEYAVNGEVYDYSIPGGGFITLRNLIEAMGLLSGDEQADIDRFVADIRDAAFSDPSLVWVGKAEADGTVGQLKAENGLECEYSAALTEAQIEEINGGAVAAGEWVLISLKPFESEETLTVTMKDGEVWTVRVTDAQSIRGATVHYGYMTGNTFHEFTAAQFTPPTSGFGNPAYLIYDVPGYQYAGKTYRSSSATSNMSAWSVSEVDPPLIQGTANNYHYYVTYEPRPAAAPGGDGNVTPSYPEQPTVEKHSVENPDTGTNTISLEVTGKRNTQRHKEDVIVIYDVSGSMQFRIGFNSETDIGKDENGEKYFVREGDDDYVLQRNRIVKEAIKGLATALMDGQTGNDPTVRMALVPFSTTVGNIVGFTGNANTFNNAVEALALGGGTNWEAALQAANAMTVRSDAYTTVIFVTDGNPTVRITREGLSDAQLTGSGGKSGINYNGEIYKKYGYFGTGNVDPDKTTELTVAANNAAAKTIADAIVASNKKLYGIGISPEVTKLVALIADQNKVFSAASAESVEAAVNTIKLDIQESIYGYSSVEINDGITPLTQTVEKTGKTDLPESDDFEYFKGHAATQADVDAGRAANIGDTVWETWTAAQMTAENAGRARYNSDTGAVEWKLGDAFMLEDGITYKVDFTVWPSQAAYDLLADLNNGVKDYDTLPQSVKDQIKRTGEGTAASYTLKTNEDDAGYSYRQATKEGENGTVTPNGNPITGVFEPVIPLRLRSDKIAIQKAFSNLLDSTDPTQINMELWGDRLYKTFTLTKNNGWRADNNYISCGLLTVDKTTGQLYLYETGHDFTLKETGEDSIYWELTADTWRPMVINDVLHMLSKVDAPANMPASAKYYSEGGREYYRIQGGVYQDGGTDAVLRAVNDHRSFLDLSKSVVDDNGSAVSTDDMFSFTATFHESRADDSIIFTIYDTVGKAYISDQSFTSAELLSAGEGENVRPYYVVENNKEFTLTIRQGWNVRFLNLSNGTTYQIEEALDADTGYGLVRIDGSASKKDTEDHSAPVETHMTITPGSAAMNGTIGEPNVLYSVAYVNKAPKAMVQILKTDQSGSTPLKGAKFSLYGSDYRDSEGKVDSTAQALIASIVSDTDGLLDLGELTYGTYYLVEEKAPDGYILLAEPVKIALSASPSYDQSGSTMSLSGSGITPLKDAEQKVIGFQFKVTNNAGYALPSTGGAGTGTFKLMGGMLILLAGAGFILLQRKKSEV